MFKSRRKAKLEAQDEREFSINYFGETLFFKHAKLRMLMPSQEHLRFYSEELKRPVFAFLKDAQVEYGGKRLSYRKFVKKSRFNPHAY